MSALIFEAPLELVIPQREYVVWVEEAKKAETRQRRIDGTIERLG